MLIACIFSDRFCIHAPVALITYTDQSFNVKTTGRVNNIDRLVIDSTSRILLGKLCILASSQPF